MNKQTNQPFVYARPVMNEVNNFIPSNVPTFVSNGSRIVNIPTSYPIGYQPYVYPVLSTGQPVSQISPFCAGFTMGQPVQQPVTQPAVRQQPVVQQQSVSQPSVKPAVPTTKGIMKDDLVSEITEKILSSDKMEKRINESVKRKLNEVNCTNQPQFELNHVEEIKKLAALIKESKQILDEERNELIAMRKILDEERKEIEELKRSVSNCMNMNNEEIILDESLDNEVEEIKFDTNQIEFQTVLSLFDHIDKLELTPDEKFLYIKIDGEYPIIPLTKTIMPFFETLFNEKEMKDIHTRIKSLVGLKSKHFKPYEDIVRLWYIHSNQRKNYSICMTGQGLQKLVNNILENIVDKEDKMRIMEIKNKTNQFIRKYKCIYLFKNIEMKNNYSSLSYSSLDEEETEDDFIERKRRRL